MQTIKELRRKIKGANDLHSVAKTMKVLAAISIRQYERAVESLDDYNRTIEMGLQIVMRNLPTDIAIRKAGTNNNFGGIIVGSEQGMSGQFNEEIVSYAIEKMQKLVINQENRIIMGLGERVTDRLEGAGFPVGEPMPFFPGSLVGIQDVLYEVLLKIEDWQFNRAIDQIVIFHHKITSKASYEPNMLQLLPINGEWLQYLKERQWPSRSLPTYTMEWDQLFSALIRQYLFVSLYRAFVESLASENASRLAAMQAAEKNITERLDELNFQYRLQRQSNITSELLDIVAGFEALSGSQSFGDTDESGSN